MVDDVFWMFLRLRVLQCNGSQLRTIDSLDVLGANWRPDTVGALWVVICPVGFRLMNHVSFRTHRMLAIVLCWKCLSLAWSTAPPLPRAGTDADRVTVRRLDTKISIVRRVQPTTTCTGGSMSCSGRDAQHCKVAFGGRLSDVSGFSDPPTPSISAIHAQRELR